MSKFFKRTAQITSVLLILLLIAGVVFGIYVKQNRTEERQGCTQGTDIYWTQRLRVSEESLYLLYKASAGGRLMYEIAAECVRDKEILEKNYFYYSFESFYFPYSFDYDTYLYFVPFFMQRMYIPLPNETYPTTIWEVEIDASNLFRTSTTGVRYPIGHVALSPSGATPGDASTDKWNDPKEYVLMNTSYSYVLNLEKLEDRKYVPLYQGQTKNGVSFTSYTKEASILRFLPSQYAFTIIPGARGEIVIPAAMDGLPTYLEQCELVSLEEYFNTSETLSENTAQEWEQIQTIHAILWGFIIVFALNLLLLLGSSISLVCIKIKHSKN